MKKIKVHIWTIILFIVLYLIGNYFMIIFKNHYFYGLIFPFYNLIHFPINLLIVSKNLELSLKFKRKDGLKLYCFK